MAIPGVDSLCLTFHSLCHAQAACVVPGKMPNTPCSPCVCTQGSLWPPAHPGGDRETWACMGCCLPSMAWSPPRWPQPPSVLAGGTLSSRKTLAARSAMRASASHEKPARDINGAARLMQPLVGALLPIPHTAVEGHRFGLSRIHPHLPDGSYGLEGQSCQELSPPFPVRELGVTPRV